MKKSAVVTGGNKGIGLAIVRALCKQFDGDVYLTSRDTERGLQTVEQLKNEGLNAKYYALDVTDKLSINKFREHLSANYGGLDILINNAGVAYRVKSPVPFPEQAARTIGTNYTGVMNMCETMFPILKSGGRVVHVTSSAATSLMQELTEQQSEHITAIKSTEGVDELMSSFVAGAETRTCADMHWPHTAYSTSKLGVALITPIQQAHFNADTTRHNIVVNCCCPGFVSTDMSDHKGVLSPDEGAETPVHLALLPEGAHSPRGEFVKEKKVYRWQDGQFPPDVYVKSLAAKS